MKTVSGEEPMRRDTRREPGRFGWDGGFIGILLTQRFMDSPEPPAVFNDFWRLAYRSLAG
jgi:hypothetical protein